MFVARADAGTLVMSCATVGRCSGGGKAGLLAFGLADAAAWRAWH